MIRIPGNHTPNINNRSSKHLIPFTKIKPIVKCVSNAQLEKWAAVNFPGANAELKRRRDKKAKKDSKL